MVDKRIRIILDNSQAKRGAKETDDSLKNVGRSADRAQFSMNKLAAAIGAVITAGALKSIADMVQNYQAMDERIRMATRSTEEYEMVTRRLAETADGTYRELSEAQELYILTQSALRDLGYETSHVLDITDSLSYAFVRNATSQDRARSAVDQLSKSIQKGKVEADSWASILAAVPTIVEDISSATGKATSEISRLGASGKLSITDLTEGLRMARDANKELSDGMAVNLTDAGVRARNALTLLFVEIEKNTGAIQNFTDGVVNGANLLTENIDTAIQVIELLAVVIGSRLAAAVVTNTAAIVAQNAALLKSTVTMNAFGQVVARTTVAQNVMAASSRGLAAGMALLGGPVGAVILAATALIYFADKAQETRSESELLEDQINKVTAAYKDLDEQATINQIAELGRQAEAVRKEMELLADRINKAANKARQANQISMQSGSVAADGVRALRSEYDSLDNKLKVLIGTQERLRKVIEDPYDLKGEDPFASDEPVVRSPVLRDSSSDGKRTDDTGKREIDQAQNITRQLRNELNLRLQIADIYRQKTLNADATLYEQQLAAIQAREAEELARLQAKAVEDQIRRDEQFRQALENEKLQEEERIILRQEQAAQQLLAEQILEQERTAILQEGIDARQRLREAEKQMAISTALSLGGQLMNLAQGQSKRAFELSKKAAIASAVISGGKAAVDAWSAGMSTGGPWAPAIAAAYTAASLLQTGNLIKNIRGQSFNGGGGSGGTSISAGAAMGGGGGSGGDAQIPSNINTQQLQQRRVIELRGISPGDLLTGEQVASLFESDDNVIVAFENAREDAQRRNVIGVTAR